MLLNASNLSKSIGARYLFKDISFNILAGEKVALIGRNGNGKTTLLKMLNGEDHDFEGSIVTSRGINITLTKQEHIHNLEQSPLDYIISSVPNYFKYKKIMEDYEKGLSADVERYLKTLEHFTENKFFSLTEAVLSTLSDFNIPRESSHQPLGNLSGGQKR